MALSWHEWLRAGSAGALYGSFICAFRDMRISLRFKQLTNVYQVIVGRLSKLFWQNF